MFLKLLLAIGLFAAALFMHAGLLSAQWVPTNGPGDGPAVNAFAAIDSDLFAGTDNGVFVSSDNGVSWNAPNSGLAAPVTALLAHGNELFAASFGMIYLSTDLGSNWTPEDSAFFANVNASVLLLASNGATLFAATEATASFGDPGGNIFRSTDNGVSWMAADSTFPNDVTIFAMVASGNALFVATSQGVYGSFDEGASWKLTNAGLGKSMVMSLATLGPILFSGTNVVMTSIDGGNSWQQASNGLPKAGVNAFTVSGTTLYAGTSDSGVYRSLDSGKSWTSANGGISSINIQALMSAGTNLFAGVTSGGGIFRSTDGGLSWALSGAGMMTSVVNSLTVSGMKLFAALDNGGGMFFTQDAGLNWNKGFGANYVFAPSGNDSLLFAIDFGEVFRSTDRETTWDSVLDKVLEFTCFTNSDSVYFLAGSGGVDGGIYRSTDKGLHWEATNSGLTNGAVYSLACNGPDIYAGTFGSGVFCSTDYGKNWRPANSGIENSEIYALIFHGTSIFAGINDNGGGIARSDDSGKNWTMVTNGLPNTFETDVYDFAVTGSDIFAGSDYGLFLSTNNGGNWIEADTGLPNQTIVSLAILGPNIYAATMGNGVWRRSLSDFGISSVAQSSSPVPEIQSYPNPFSQRATITFSSEAESYADVRVVNLLGAEVAQLFSGEVSAGEHEFSWDASGFAPGMYECVVRVNGRVQRISMAHVR